METTQSQPSLATDHSLSLRWLPQNPSTSIDSHGDFAAQSLHENDHKTTHNFTFDVSVSSPNNLLSNDLFMPCLTNHQKSISMGKFSRFSRKFLHKCLIFLFPSSPRRGKRVDDLNKMRSASAYSERSDYETSIYEAILYCKRSSGQ